ncbi:hypothetical protein K4749_40470 [Streptomyces sp. TRM72054]|uniref:hypothetical protein n=1 Tax=Streptomyces TaxID=1883 RepID=UPI001489FE92|nr:MULTISPECIES: hypothetical protein [Streptomyces]MBX9399614.1 hypothetical protein [Streptomyces sp. TRM72054]
MKRYLRRALAPALMGCLALSLTACGGGREYTVPDEACGVPLNEKMIEPFLVDGKELKVVGDLLIDSKGKTWAKCEISVDDWLVIGLQVDQVDKLYDPMDDSESFRFENRTTMENLPFSGLGALGDRSSMVSTDCAGPKADHLITYVYISTKAGGDVAERRENIEAFTLDFVPKVKQKLGCSA